MTLGLSCRIDAVVTSRATARNDAGMVHHRARKCRSSLMAKVARLSRRDVGRRFAQRRRTVVAGRTSTRSNAGMVHHRAGEGRRSLVAKIA